MNLLSLCGCFENNIGSFFKDEQSTTEYDKDAFFFHGCEYQTAGNFEEAILCYKSCIDIDKNHANAIFNMANCYLKKGDLKDAICWFKRVTELNPAHHRANFNLGHLYYFEEQNLSTALYYFKAASKLNENDVDTLISIGLIQRDLGNFAESVCALQKAIDIEPSSEMANYNLGNIYHDFKMSEQAIKYFKQTTSINPCNADAFFNLGISYQRKKELTEALTCYLRAQKIDPSLQQADEAIRCLNEYMMQKNSLAA